MEAAQFTAEEKSFVFYFKLCSSFKSAMMGVSSASMNYKLIRISGGDFGAIASAHAWSVALLPYAMRLQLSITGSSSVEVHI
jgi:hypothetical protein